MTRISRVATWASLQVLKRLATRLTPGDRSWLARQLMRDRFGSDTRALADLFNKSILAWKNKQYLVSENGEAALLRRLRPFDLKILIDVGANTGDWSLAACESLPNAHIHAFEIAPATVVELNKQLRAYLTRVTVNQIGLGDRDAEVTLYHSPESSTASTIVKGVIELSAADHGIKTVDQLSVRITTGDKYIGEHGIESVDFIKIDVEGAEWDVLQGLSSAFVRNQVQLVQFEYGPLNLQTRKFLADFYEFFERHGFVIGKLYPEGVAFKKYELFDEDFVGPNFIACRAVRTDLIRALQCDNLGM